MSRIGMVVGAGGVPGGFFIRAALAALTDATGFTPNMSTTLIGTSAGALNGARIDHQPATAAPDVAARLTEVAERTAPPDRSVPDRLLATPRQVAGRLVGRFAPAGKNAPDYSVAEAPFHPGVRVVSCRRSDGARRISTLANASDPTTELFASAAIPGFAVPVVIDGVEHVDGAVWSTTNADLVAVDDHDLLVVIAPMVPSAGGSLVARSHRASLLAELAPWVHAGTPVVAVLPSADALDNRDDHAAFGRYATDQIIPD